MSGTGGGDDVSGATGPSGTVPGEPTAGGYPSAPPIAVSGTVPGEPAPPVKVAPRPRKAIKRGLLIGIAGAVVALGGVAFAAYWFWFRAAPELARYAPKDTQYYIEVPSVPKLLVGLLGVDALDDKELDAEEQSNRAAEALADSFDLKKDEAEELVTGVRAIAFAQRPNDSPKDGDYRSNQDIIMVRFSDSDVMEPLLSSKRFDKDGTLAGGDRYRVYRKKQPKRESEPLDLDEPKKKVEDLVEEVSARNKKHVVEQFFDDLGEYKPDDDDESKDKEPLSEEAEEREKERRKIADTYVWFEDEKLLVYGSPEMIKDVGGIIDGDKESLATGNDRFRSVSWKSGATIIEYFDPEGLEDYKKDYFDDVSPAVGSAWFADAGLVSHLRVELAGKKLRDMQGLIPKEVSLELYKKLPADTVAYMAVSSKLEGDGKDFVKSLTKVVDNYDDESAKELDDALDKMKEEAGFGLDTIIDAMGDEFVIAATAEDRAVSAMTEEGPSAGLRHVGFVGIFRIKDIDAADKIMKSARNKAQDLAEASGDKVFFKRLDEGFSITFEEGSIVPIEFVSVEIREEKYVLIAGGAKKRVNAIKDAFDGEGDLLADDKAHKRALSVLGDDAQALLWVDSARILRGYMRAFPDGKREAKKVGIPVDALVLDEDIRPTSGFSVKIDVREDSLVYEGIGLNYPTLLGWVQAIIPRKKFEEREATSEPVEEIPYIGVTDCDATIKFVEKCAKSIGGTEGETMRKDMLSSAKVWQSIMKQPSGEETLEVACKTALENAKKNPKCE